MAITFDSKSNGGVANTQTSRTWSHTIGSGDNRILVVLAMARDSSGTGDEVVSSITYGGVSLTSAGTVENTGITRCEVWYLSEPTEGTANIVVTYAGSCQTVSTMAASFFGVNLSNLAVVETESTGTGTSVSVATSGNIGDLVIGQVAADTSTSNSTTSGTALFNNDGSRQHGGSYEILGAASFDLTFSLGGSAVYAANGIKIKAYSYTFVSKPTGTPYISVNGVGGGREGFDDAAVLFDDPSVFFDGSDPAAYTTVSKPTGTPYTNITKPA